MIDFRKITPEDKSLYESCKQGISERGCEFSFANLYLWGRQRIAFIEGHVLLFSQFNRRTVYPYPVGKGDKKAVIDAIIADAKERGIPCRITGLNAEARGVMEQLYPGDFRYHCDRDSFDYVYDINDLADLAGKKYQKKRNHVNKFKAQNPDFSLEPISAENIETVRAMIDGWYEARLAEDPEADFIMERAALEKALRDYSRLEMEGLALVCGGRIVAVTLGSRMSENTFDVHFEKAAPDVQGAYTAIASFFACYIRERHPDVAFLNREEDMGIEGLRKSKESYYPHHMVEKCWACLLEDGCDY